MSKYLKLCVLFALIVCGNSVFSADEQKENSEIATLTAEKAVNLAVEYLGFDELDGFVLPDSIEKIATYTIAKDSTTPFLHTRINGRPAWRIIFANIILDLKSTTSEQEEQHLKDFEILIDAKTGQLLKIRCSEPVYRGTLDREPTHEEAENQISHIGEMYHNLPEKLPIVSFYDALNKNKFYPLYAKEIIGSYVTYSSRKYKEIRACWIVYMRGLAPRSARAIEEGNTHIYTNERVVVDATTGWSLLKINLPYPELNNKGKK